MRTSIYLSDEDVAGLAEFCEAEHISRAEAVRRAVKPLLEDREALSQRAWITKYAGIWAPRDFDAREYIDELREEWSERERRLGLQP